MENMCFDHLLMLTIARALSQYPQHPVSTVALKVHLSSDAFLVRESGALSSNVHFLNGRYACEQEVTNLVWSFAKIGSPLSEEASALMDMVPNEVLLQLSDESRRCKVRPTCKSSTSGTEHMNSGLV